MNPRLRVEVGLEIDREYEIRPASEQPAAWLGRGGMCFIKLGDQQLSRKHCRFVYDGAKFVVEDPGSRNGTRVNGSRVSGTQELHHNDRVTVGSHALVVVWPAASHQQKAELTRIGTQDELDAAYRKVAQLAGSDFAGYHLDEVVFNGVSSVVFRATDPHKEMPVAVKFLKPLAKVSEEDRQRMLRGARLGASLRHPGFVRVLKGGRTEDLCYVAMEYVEGRSVQDMVERKGGPLDLKLSVEIVRQVLRALQFAHQHKIVFGGAYPDNIIVGSRLAVKLTDFDLVRKLATGGEAPTVSEEAETRSMHMNWSFAAPEQIAYPNVADPRSDIMCTGAVMYYMMCGRAPFERTLPGKRLTSAFERHAETPRSLNPAIPDFIVGILEQSLSEYSRFNSTEDMLNIVDEAARLV